jgi:hypothetical protein
VDSQRLVWRDGINSELREQVSDKFEFIGGVEYKAVDVTKYDAVNNPHRHLLGI